MEAFLPMRPIVSVSRLAGYPNLNFRGMRQMNDWSRLAVGPPPTRTDS